MHMKIIKNLVVISLFLTVYASCNDSLNNESDFMNQGKINSERDSTLREFLTRVSELETKETTALNSNFVSERKESVKLIDGKYYIPTWTTYNMKGLEMIPADRMNSSFLDVIWPGNLIQGQSVYDIGLSSVPLGIMRKPGTIFLAAVSGKNVNYSRNIESFTASNINQAMNDIMAEHGFQDLPAYINYTMHDISCEEEIAYKMDMDMKTFKRLVGDSFSNKDWKSRKTRKIVSLDQELFTMVYEFNGMNEVFKDDMDTEYLAPYTYEGNPMCYISSVTYGRSMIFFFETEETFESHKVLEKAIHNTFNFNDTIADKLTDEDRKILSKTSVSLFVMGGNADNALQAVTGGSDKIREFMLSSVGKAGVPIRYKLNYLGNNRVVNTYKEINTNFEILENVEEEKNNNVLITIGNIKSDALKISGGNFSYVRWDSNFSVSNIKVELLDDNGEKVIDSRSYNPQINISATSSYNRNHYKVISFGELGVNTDKRIKISYDVKYFGRRYAKNIFGGTNSSDGSTKTIYFNVVYSFDKLKQKWIISSKNEDADIYINAMSATGSVDYCRYNFRLDYSFSANRETYK